MKYLRLLLSAMAVSAAVLWSRLILPWRNEPMPFSGWSDGSGGNAASLELPIILLWFATIFAFGFIAIKPHVQFENGLTRVGRWITNAMLFPIALVLVFYAANGEPARFLAVYGFVSLAALWIFVDFTRQK